jgi:hypothetical protein
MEFVQSTLNQKLFGGPDSTLFPTRSVNCAWRFKCPKTCLELQQVVKNACFHAFCLAMLQQTNYHDAVENRSN